ncbi:solute carrier family 45 member 4-like isoform X2 [Entelurus aequoreus]|uniref:solute carrier family 45 member 4-like isoform X2 n=1 Tax=Entelurus aequoreus TaxID=161455 RepID=UPI002B1E3F4A|nr:solute carrier family 45 member 4-like isoform X2 [Entelurus aequoreus]
MGEVAAPAKRKPMENANDCKSEKDAEEAVDEDVRRPIPMHRWVMHGAVMFGREFCYAMETALVTPVLLQIGLPKHYYSLTWFLSPVLGLLLTPVMGSASDSCTLRWGRRRPFILALCVGVLLGMALFLNGSLIGLSLGDHVGSQPIGIVLTVLGVVVLDFSADACDGPIRAYLLDVAVTEEQDIALNIHTFSSGIGGAIGYMLGGLDWTGTALGQAFKSQQQVLFLFAAIFFITSVILHMFSIPERPLGPAPQPIAAKRRELSSQLSSRPVSHIPPLLDIITEEDASFREDDQSDPEAREMDFLVMERVRSKSDSVLAMPDTTIKLDPDLDPEVQLFLPEVQKGLTEIQAGLQDSFKFSDQGTVGSSKLTDGMVLVESGGCAPSELNGHTNSPSTEGSHVKPMTTLSNGVTEHCNSNKSHISNKPGTRLLGAAASPRPHKHTFYRQPSFTFSYYGRVGSQRHRLRRTTASSPPPITTSRSLNDLSDLQQRLDRREFQFSTRSLSSEASSSDSKSDKGTTVRLLWLSMLKMPKQLWRLCVCHLVTWFSYIAEAVFYTDFMGQVIYNGDPQAPLNSTEFQNYNSGVQMGCWGLVVYAGTAAVSSAILQKYLDNFDLSIKVVYIVGTLGFSIGTAVMAIFPNVYVAMVMISSMGVSSMSISYCPYALLGQYHEIKEVYISQILVASVLGSVIRAVGTVRVIPMVASGSSFLGFLTACFLVVYPDEESNKDQDSARLSAELNQNGKKNSDRSSLQKLTDRDSVKNRKIVNNEQHE